MIGARARRAAGVFVVAGWFAALGLGASGCSPKGVIAPNTEPQTTLFVQFDPGDALNHTVNHEVHLYWYGTDVDGEVVAYEFRFLEPGGPADPPWSRTTRTDSLFTIQVPTGTLIPTFEVRAIDNDGAIDPSPAVQEFSFSNAAPTVTLADPPRMPNDTTFATQTIAWTGIDPDGDASRLIYRVWLDGNEATPHVITAQRFTFPSADFLQSGQYQSGTRTAFVQALDAGGRASVVQSATWYVRAPAAAPAGKRLLLIDNVPTTNPANPPTDNVYNQTLIRNGIVANTTVLRLQTGRPFRSSADLYQTLKLFDAVVWYRGTERYFSTRDTLLVRHQVAVVAYVNEGGRFYFESLDMVDGEGASGILSPQFLTDVLACDSLHQYKPTNSDDFTVDWGIPSSAVLSSVLYADSLRTAAIFSGMRGFAPSDTNDVALWGRANRLDPAVPYDIPVAVRTNSGAGRMVAISVPLVGLNGFASVPRFLDKIFADLGVTGPAPPSFVRTHRGSTSLNQRYRSSRRGR